MNILITGGAGFIGSHLVERLLVNHNVSVIDNFDNFYSKDNKIKNISYFTNNKKFKLYDVDILDVESINNIEGEYDILIHLAAKAGVGQSLENKDLYYNVNVVGTKNVLDLAVNKGIKKFIFTSSSSVYGSNINYPWTENNILHPISPYANTKSIGENLGSIYTSKGIEFTSLRLFTVYGPRIRPDLAIYKFSEKIINGDEIIIYGDGNSGRDYTYIDDVIDGIESSLYCEGGVFNIGSGVVVNIMEMIKTLEIIFNKKSFLTFVPEKTWDIHTTHSDLNKSNKILNYNPKVNFIEGINKFKEWFMEIKKPN